MAADDLAMQVARASAAMVLAWFAPNIPASSPKGLTTTELKTNIQGGQK